MGHSESTHLKPAFMRNAFYSEKSTFKKKRQNQCDQEEKKIRQ